MDLKLEISGEKVVCTQDGEAALSGRLTDFLHTLVDRVDAPPPDEAIPEGVRFTWTRGAAAVMVYEEKPAVRTVRWLEDDSKAPYGPKAKYRQARLSFPYIVIVVGFDGGALTGQHQCFYRVQPLRSIDDELLLPNLLNVSPRSYGQDAWLCLAGLKENVAGMSWADKRRAIASHVFEAGFSRSSEINEGASYYGEMRSLDERIASLSAWEQATAADPLFMLKLPWKPLGRSIGDVMSETLAKLAAPYRPARAADLVPLLSAAAPQIPHRRWLWFK